MKTKRIAFLLLAALLLFPILTTLVATVNAIPYAPVASSITPSSTFTLGRLYFMVFILILTIIVYAFRARTPVVYREKTFSSPNIPP